MLSTGTPREQELEYIAARTELQPGEQTTYSEFSGCSATYLITTSKDH